MIWRTLFILAILSTEVSAFNWPGRYWPSNPTVKANQNGTPDCDGEFTAIQNGMQAWSSVTTTSFAITYGGTTSASVGSDGTNTIAWIEDGWEGLGFQVSWIGATITWYNPNTGVIYETDIALNGEYYTWSSSGQAGRFDVQNVATHELGHVAGLGDLYGGGDAEKTMYGYITTGETKKRTLELDDQDGLRYIYFDPTVNGTLTEDQRWVPSRFGTTINLTGNVTVPSGKTLDIQSSLTISAGGYYKMRIEGKLLAASSTFTRSGGQWYGIEFYSGNSGSSLSYATIQNAQYGVYIYNTAVSVSHCTIRYNTNGVYTASYYGSINWSLLHDNGYGVKCGSNGDPDVSPNNIIRYNGRGVYAESGGIPNLGSTAGYNSVCYNDYYDVESYYGGTIYALGNWWGDYPPEPSIVGTVDYSSALSVDPNGWAKIAVATPPESPASVLTGPGGVVEDTTGIAELDGAYRLLRADEKAQAFASFNDLVAKYPDAFVGSRALVTAVRLAEGLKLDSQRLLREVVAKHEGHRLAETAKLQLVGYLVKEGNPTEAFDISASLVESLHEDIAKHALFNAGNIAWYRLDDQSRGEAYYRRLIERFPTDPLAESAMATLGIEPIAPPGSEKLAEGKVEEFKLGDCYPNPFNPTTKITFSLPEPSFVELKVFDILGREVGVLVDGLTEPGIHVAQWDGGNHASGVYLARFLVRDQVGRVKYQNVARLLLAK